MKQNSIYFSNRFFILPCLCVCLSLCVLCSSLTSVGFAAQKSDGTLWMFDANNPWVIEATEKLNSWVANIQIDMYQKRLKEYQEYQKREKAKEHINVLKWLKDNRFGIRTKRDTLIGWIRNTAGDLEEEKRAQKRKVRDLAYSLYSDEKWQESREVWEKVLRLEGESSTAFYYIGRCLLYQIEEGLIEMNEENVLEMLSYLKKSLKDDPDFSPIYYYRGIGLGFLAELKHDSQIFKQAGDQYIETIKRDADFAPAYANLGYTLISRANFLAADSPQREGFYKEAVVVLEKSEKIHPGISAYNLACIAALRNKPAECRKWLKAMLIHEEHLDCAHFKQDSDFDSVRDKQWFKDFEAKYCGE